MNITSWLRLGHQSEKRSGFRLVFWVRLAENLTARPFSKGCIVLLMGCRLRRWYIDGHHKHMEMIKEYAALQHSLHWNDRDAASESLDDQTQL